MIRVSCLMCFEMLYLIFNENADTDFEPPSIVWQNSYYTCALLWACDLCGSVLIRYNNYLIVCVGAPIYTNVLTDHEVNKGDSFSVILNLEKLGDSFTYVWTKNGIQFKANSNINVTVTSLFIASADCGDNGIYNVTATNQFGSDWLSFRLTVLCKLHFCIINNC